MTKFKKALIIYSASLALLIAAAIGVLALFLDTYEKNLPEKAAKKYISELNDGGIAPLVENALGGISFENAEDIISSSEALSGDFKTSKLVKESTQNAPVYRIISSLGDVGKFSLVRSEKKALFGLSKWEVGERTVYPEALGRAYDYSVCVPAGKALKANGKPVDGGFITEKDAAYNGKAVTGRDVKCDIYKISGLYTVPQFECGGEVLAGVSDGTADFFASESASVRVTLPSDAKLLLDGTEPSAKKAEKGDILSSVSEFEKNIPEKLPRMLTYTVYRGQKMPEISVTAGGKQLAAKETESGDLVFLYGDDSMYALTSVIPEGAVLRINGINVSGEYARGGSSFDGLSASSKYIKDMADGILYSVTGLLCRPEITAEMNGKELHVCYTAENGRNLHAEFYGESVGPTEAEKNFAEDFSRRYFKYAINGAEGIDKNLEELLAVMKNGSEGYKRIKSTKIAFMFVNKATYRINRLDVTNFIRLGDNAFTCDIEFDVKLRIFGTEKNYVGTLGITAVKDGGSYLVCDISTDSASDTANASDAQSERK